MKKIYFLLTVLLLSSLVSVNLFAQIDVRLLQYPDVSQTQIVFEYGGDLWIVAKEGGVAHKLTTPKGTEVLPRFSPDGTHLAFSGNYQGNTDVYVIQSKGGMPLRITHNGYVDRMVDWNPDGEHLLYASIMESGRTRFNQFYSVSDKGGLPDKLSLPYAEFGCYSPDGKMLAFTPRTRAFRTWKRYRGGMAADIWIYNFDKKTAENITNSAANDEFPMWHANTIYFLSDNGSAQRNNIWAYDIKIKETRQITNFTDFDVHFPAIGPSDIVFEAGGKLYLLDLATEKYNEVKVEVVTDEATLLPKAENAKKYIQNWWPSPDGKRAIFEARGDLFSVPAENGPVYDLTNTSGYAERYPSWSPNGKYIAYWSDRSGEYELTLRDMENPSSEKKLTSYGPGYRYQIFWSPDSKKLAFIDKAMTIYIFDMDKDKTIKVNQEKFMYQGNLVNFSVSWSSDSRWLAYSKEQDNLHGAIFIFDTKEEKNHQVTSGYFHDRHPQFDPDGKYLYYLTGRNLKPVYSDIDATWIYPNSTNIAVVGLTETTESPLAPKNDVAVITKDDEKENNKDEKKEEKPKDVKITFDGFESRVVLLPPDPGNYTTLDAVAGKVVYLRLPNTGSGEKEKDLIYYDLENREEKTIAKGIDNYQLTTDGKKALLSKSGSYYIVDVAPDQKLEKNMPVDRMEMTVLPKEEWHQIFNDAWRFERDFFYDPNMHGLNWEEMRTRYGNLIDNAVTRSDVNYIIGELIGEISSSHTYRGGGDQETPSHRAVGYLGVDWTLNNGAYQIKKIIKAAPWDTENKSPLYQSGVKVKEGDYILAVNGVSIDVTKDPWAAFEGLAGETIELTVNNKPSIDGAWKVVVETLKGETTLRNLAWIEENRKTVEKATDGKIGYIYVQDTGIRGQDMLVKQFSAQIDKEGLIIDERFNSGGQIPDRFIELLNRKPLAFWAVRDGVNWQWPQVANFGPKVMLINGWSGSGGDAFPDYFRKAGLGPLIGQRTWGGLIGISGAPSLIDGGFLTVPTFRMYDPDGEWFKEGHGVDPDIEVIQNPAELAKGNDQQLQAGIDEVMKLLKENPPVHPKQPPYEKR